MSLYKIYYTKPHIQQNSAYLKFSVDVLKGWFRKCLKDDDCYEGGVLVYVSLIISSMFVVICFIVALYKNKFRQNENCVVCVCSCWIFYLLSDFVWLNLVPYFRFYCAYKLELFIFALEENNWIKLFRPADCWCWNFDNDIISCSLFEFISICHSVD